MTDETTSLPSCERNHPGVASDIKLVLCTNDAGTTFPRRTCTVCKMTIARARREKEAAERCAAVPHPLVPYGVVRLSWTPPEVLLAVSA